MLPRKPYAFVCYLTEEEAEAAYTALNGFKLTATEDRQEEITLYILYVSQAPASIQPSTTMPPGLILLKDFITDEYAAEIMSSINWDSGGRDQEKELKHRKVKHYGYEFKYSINNVDPDDPLEEGIPQVYKKLLDKALETGHVKFYPDQLTINQYQPGQGIPPHVDTTSAFEDGLMSLSLGSQVNMEFHHPDGLELSVLLPPNSLLIMTGESRYFWSHGITPKKHDIVPAAGGGLTLSKRGVRTSFTFRKITGVHPGETVSNSSKADLQISENDAAELEKEHVHQVYEEIAGHFSGTRHSPWPNIVEFINQQEPGSMLADFGCGNGKYFDINKRLFEIGSDRSFNLAEICKERKFEVFVGDVLSIPLRTGVFDVCLCIAVIHHLATEERRLKAVQELMKILRVGGKALIYVWAMEQELNKVKSKYLKSNKGQSSGNAEGVCNLSEVQAEICERCHLEGNTSNTMKEDNLEKNSKGDLTSEVLKGNFCDMSLSDGGASIVTEKNFSDMIKDSSRHSQTADRDTSSLHCDSHGKKTDKEYTGKSSTETIESSDINSVIPTDKTKTDGKSVSMPALNEDLQIHESIQTEAKTSIESSVKICNTVDTKSDNLKKLSDTCSATDKEFGYRTVAKAEETTKTKLQVHVNRTEFKQQDLLVPWQLKGKKKPELDKTSSDNTFHRFYHVFKKGELELLCSRVPHCKIVHSYYDQGNWAVILEKL